MVIPDISHILCIIPRTTMLKKNIGNYVIYNIKYKIINKFTPLHLPIDFNNIYFYSVLNLSKIKSIGNFKICMFEN